MNDDHSSMAANAICHAALMCQESIQSAVAEFGEMAMFSLLKPRLFLDGKEWCVLYGDNLQSGVSGFGDSPRKAIQDWNQNMHKPIEALQKRVGEV
jgi:hypothetical protein